MAHPPTTSGTPAVRRLVSAYERGMLVPFVGAGISAPNCTLWPEFVAELEVQAGVARSRAAHRGHAKPSPASLIQRAARAVRRLRQDEPDRLSSSIREALRSKKRHRVPPPTGTALAKLWWPLVITTNYDDWFYASRNSHLSADDPKRRVFERMEVCGRGSADCERVLNSLRAPDNPLLWAIQGFVGGLADDGFYYEDNTPAWKCQMLAEELIVGHAEYRREAYRSVGFRRAFSEVFRSRAFLFIGSGLTESYFESLFDETLELQGTLGHEHYALVKRNTLDPRLLRERFQIEAIEYRSHSELPGWLESLRRTISTRGNRAASWGAQLGKERYPAGADLQIVRSELSAPGPDECLLLSAGHPTRNDKRISKSGLEAARRHFPSISESTARRVRNAPTVWKFGTERVLAVIARDPEPDGRAARDARVIADAMRQALDVAVKRYDSMRATLLAAGRNRVFSPHVSMIQMVRGFAAWKRRNKGVPFRLTIDVVDPLPLHMLAASRINLTEILEVDEVRFWVEIWRTQSEISRFLRIAAPNHAIRKVLDELDVPKNGWEAQVVPSPIGSEKWVASEEINSARIPWTIDSIGILPGSTLRIIPDRLGITGS